MRRRHRYFVRACSAGEFWAATCTRRYLLDADEFGRWRVAAKSARTIAVTEETETDAEIAKLVEPYDRETQGWLARVIGESGAELTAGEARFRDTAILDSFSACSWKRAKRTCQWWRVSTRRRVCRKAR
jgi:2',3'-cyclic-nucleotide 2'-phosphodiesterase (5'-nucleotidase family)